MHTPVLVLTSTGGRRGAPYASYWNAFLFYASFTLLCFFTNLIMHLPVNGIMNVSLDMSADGYNDTKELRCEEVLGWIIIGLKSGKNLFGAKLHNNVWNYREHSSLPLAPSKAVDIGHIAAIYSLSFIDKWRTLWDSVKQLFVNNFDNFKLPLLILRPVQLLASSLYCYKLTGH